MLMSILKEVRSYIGFEGEEECGYEREIINTINSVLSTLYHIGVGVDRFQIKGTEETWEDFYPNIQNKPEIREYVCIRCLLSINPPDSIKLIETLNERIQEITFYLNIEED